MTDEPLHNTAQPAIADHEAALQRRDQVQFQHEMEKLINEAEDTRLRYMRSYRKRGFISMAVGIISVLAGSGGFGWFLLMHANLPMGIASIGAAILPPIILAPWTKAPLKAYIKHHKTNFMPKMAHILGGFKFFAHRGISSKIIQKTGVIPPHALYEAEDCFMGKYKGVKVILSEARLYPKKKKKNPVFDGIFVLLELPTSLIEGHTIITADLDMAKMSATTRWSKLSPVPLPEIDPEWRHFQIFSSKPEAASLMVGARFLKELAEAAAVFDHAPLSAVLLGHKFIFLAIPYEDDMFEASNMHIPVSTKTHAAQCKKEVEQILEIIDLFDLYKTEKTGDALT